MALWCFSKHNGLDDINASTSADNFIQLRDAATALVREGVQNALDARLDRTRPVRVRITIAPRINRSEPRQMNSRWFGALMPHLHEPDVGAPDPPAGDEVCDAIIFEDFNTRGLTGDPMAPYSPGAIPPNDFVSFMYHDGVTEKGNKQGGSRGVGKIVFYMASRARTIFAYTVRSNDRARPVLIGKNFLKFRQYRGELFPGPAYYLEAWPSGKPRAPVTDAHTIQAFLDDFPVSRRSEPGLSVVIPFVDLDEFSFDRLQRAVISECYYAMLSGDLEVTVADPHQSKTFNRDHVPSSGHPSIDADIELARWALSQGTRETSSTLAPPSEQLQKLELELVPTTVREEIANALSSRQRVALRMRLHIHPKNLDPIPVYFNVFLEYSEGPATKPLFVRELLQISDVKDARPGNHVRALVVIGAGPLADFLRAAEGANHTDWSPRAGKFQELYRQRLGEIAFVSKSVNELISLVRGDSEKPVGGIATPFFSAQIPGKPETKTKKQTGRGPRPPKPVVELPEPSRTYRIVQRKDGFSICAETNAKVVPAEIAVKVAYDVLVGNAWSQYSMEDFDLNDRLGPIRVQSKAATIKYDGSTGNRFVIAPQNDAFEVSVTGFDSNRDLIVDVKPRSSSKNANAPELHKSDEAASE